MLPGLIVTSLRHCRLFKLNLCVHNSISSLIVAGDVSIGKDAEHLERLLSRVHVLVVIVEFNVVVFFPISLAILERVPRCSLRRGLFGVVRKVLHDGTESRFIVRFICHSLALGRRGAYDGRLLRLLTGLHLPLGFLGELDAFCFEVVTYAGKARRGSLVGNPEVFSNQGVVGSLTMLVSV